MNQDKNDISLYHQYKRSDHPMLNRLGLHMESTVIYEDFPPHRHEFTDAFFIIDGTAVHQIGEYAIRLKKGDVFVVKGDTVHAFRNAEQLSIINLMYTPALFSQMLTELQTLPGFAAFFILEPELRQKGTYTEGLRLPEDSLRYVETLSRFIIQTEEKNDSAYDGVLRMTTAALMSFLAAEYHAAFPSTHVVPVLVRALEYMKKHLHQPLMVSEIARIACVSPRHLQRMFSAYLHTHPMAYLRQLRLEHGRLLLADSSITIAEAAAACGFPDSAYFARCYKAAFGISPSSER